MGRPNLSGYGMISGHCVVGRSRTDRMRAAFNNGGPSSPSEPVELSVVVVHDGSKYKGCDPSTKELREEVQPPVEDGGLYASLLVGVSSKVTAVENARKIGVEDGEINVLEQQAKAAFLNLESEYGIRVAEHSVFGPLYQRLGVMNSCSRK